MDPSYSSVCLFMFLHVFCYLFIIMCIYYLYIFMCYYYVYIYMYVLSFYYVFLYICMYAYKNTLWIRYIRPSVCLSTYPVASITEPILRIGSN